MNHRICFLGLITAITLCVLTSPLTESAGASEPGSQSPNQKKVDKETLHKEDPLNPEAPPIAPHCPPAQFPNEFRTIDGTNNNCRYPEWGSAPIDLLRLTKVGYDDGREEPKDANRPNVRDISNIVADQGGGDIIYTRGRKYSDALWQWGQFLDHDLDLTPVVDPVEEYNIKIPEGDVHFDPEETGNATMSLERSLYVKERGVRQQMNEITAFIDASNVYGSDPTRAAALRAFNGKGYLKTSPGNLLPYNVDGLPNAAPAGTDPATFFLAGDFRANEQVGLTAMHTLFVREHNYWADHFREKDSTLNDEELYQRARAMVGAEMQHITYDEFLPLLLGRRAVSSYGGYQPNVNPGISNVFATAAYRFGHSMVGSKLRRLNERGQSVGDLPLREAFFNPGEIETKGIDGLFRGLASQVAQRFDAYMVDDLRNFLFGKPGSGGFDLASLNMQRGREHGLPNYNQVRKDFGLPRVRRFSQITRDRIIRDRLKAVYGDVKELDMWIAGIAERPVYGAVVGRTVRTILLDQFERLRSGDRFWYETYLPTDLRILVKRQTLARIIKRNTDIGSEMRNDVFLVR